MPWLAMAINTGRLAATFALEIDGKFAGLLNGFDGGDPFAEVIETPVAGGPTDKSIGPPQYDDIIVTCGLPEEPLTTWLVEFLAGKAPERAGAVIVLNLNRQPIRRLEWQRATIASLTFPALDAVEGKKAAGLTIAIRPESTRDVGGGGQLFPLVASKRKAWLQGNFAVSLPGIDTTRVMRVEPIVATQTYLPPTSGRGAPKPGPVQVSDLVITVSQTGAADFVKWSDDFIVAGNNSKAHELDATIRLLGPNLKDDLATLKILSTGIFRTDHELLGEGVATLARVKFSLYVEQVEWVAVAEPAPEPDTPPPPPAEDRDLRDVLGQRLTRDDVANRLREQPPEDPGRASVDGQRKLGRDVGFAWAQRLATMAQLRELAAADSQDWTNLSLPAGHSLAEVVAATIDIPLLQDGRLELPRDALAEGVLAGVIEALAELNEQVDV